ncbi:pilus assembly protein PilP [Rhodanobacter sp. DHB23]|uniref:pilus assembly protein PilP n=1 Tax=Rhodanobacter sp. DHB23 TaxID=2775923 RepID=UPI00177E72A0|nr:pilus assembly protein PilP [Rhodanobacter sp. DHB23]MBD8872807.1 pilus assembly protein PilP [Rhodanobacter sp. DHB23]
MKLSAAMKPVTLTRIGLLLAAVLMLGGCTRGTSDLREWIAQQKAKKGQPVPPLPVIKTFETFTYADQDLRDPFGPSAVEQDAAANSGPRPDQNRPRQPLEMFALDSLKMVGTIGAGPGTVALVKDPMGVIHQVHNGEYMGQNYGRVTAVSDDHIDLTELVSNGNGGWMERSASLALGDK